MSLEGKAVLHITYTATHFSAAPVLDSSRDSYGQSVDGISLALVQTWCTNYTGFLNRLRTDQHSVFTSRRWKKLTNLNRIKLQLSGVQVQAHSSLGIVIVYTIQLEESIETFDTTTLIHLLK